MNTEPRAGRRVAALAALCAPLIAVGAGLDELVVRPDGVLVFLVSAALGVVAIWYALTRRGLLRWLAVLVAAAAVTLLLVIGLTLFLTQILLLGVFAVAGRYALGPDAGTMFERGYAARPVPAARAGVLFVNPRSGDGKAERLDLAGEAARRGIRAVVLTPGDDLRELAERAVAGGADVLGMAGGDGSQALVASVAAAHGLAYVCVPSGTRNHFALDLGLDRDDVAGALDAYAGAVERSVDLGRVNDRVFVNNASLGVYAQVVQSGEYRAAKARTWGRLLPDLLGPAAEPPDLEFDGPDGQRYAGASLVLVSNNPYRLSRAGRAGGRPRLDTGRLGILVAARSRARLREWSRPQFEVRSTGDVPVGLDGEALVLTAPLRFASMPAALRVRLPRTAPGRRRTRRNAVLDSADLHALARIVMGQPAVR